MNTRPLLIVIGAIVVLVLLYLAFSAVNSEQMPEYGAATSTDTAVTTDTTGSPDSPAAPAAPETTTTTATTITYGPNGFSSSNVTVPVGTTVTWVNQGSDRMWVGSSLHPDHTVYDGTSTAQHCANGTPTSPAVFDQCTASARYSFIFTKPGIWFYHNHANATHFGSVTVTQ